MKKSVKINELALTSLHQHGDLAAFGTLAEQVDHLVVGHGLHVSLVHFHDYVPFFKTTTARVVHNLLDSLPSASRAVRNGKAKALVSFFHVHGDELRLRSNGRRQGHHIAGIAELGRGVGGYLGGGAVRSGEAIERCHSIRGAIVVVAAMAGRRVVAISHFLAVDNDRFFVVKNGHWGNQAGVRVIWVKGQWVATAKLQVNHGANGDGLEDFYYLGVGVAQHTYVVDTYYDVTLDKEERQFVRCNFRK